MGRVLGFLIIIAMAAIFFGAKRLPDLARSAGRSMRILKAETAALREEYTREASPTADTEPARIVKAAPGDTATARPVAEPSVGGER
ncbi:twin-arginine translocase TatA/TatE family subunit [Kitasatospora acidiphila]|uniref:Twin-arginine translocase TatA/TatE family subunit n=1 Tax=Kitasatospora acidiphila TaxID=2567942 RepID=A0A540WB23_9ACTN|nr:twin-arginine translocase TatA/TatE family subunit [Kitasatospora acidiphila]TQF06229.1 twin-arginine translocase TatA/TatE family subunit [Kitasatospora acidiphila]